MELIVRAYIAVIAIALLVQGVPRNGVHVPLIRGVPVDQDLSSLLELVPHTKQTEFGEVCYGDLGCFSNGPPFYNEQHRPISWLPSDPAIVDTKFALYTLLNPIDQQFIEPLISSIDASNFDVAKPTKFIVHGFLDTAFLNWVKDLTAALLSVGDFNVIAVDWSGGNKFPYGLACSNTRIVGAEIAKLISFLQVNYGFDPSLVHIMGHSLGAHVAGYAGERINKIGRLTGLDPAGPYFRYMDDVVRIDPTDGAFVDSIHTDASSVLGMGFGTIEALSHMDFYPNSGNSQPGCEHLDLWAIIAEGLYEGMRDIVACNHQRAIFLFTESITSSPCEFISHTCTSWEDYLAGKCRSCGANGELCAKMGYYADQYVNRATSLRVPFYTTTDKEKMKYCAFNYYFRFVLDPDSNVDNTDGEFYVVVYGVNNGVMKETQVSNDTLILNPGATYEFIIGSQEDISPAQRLEFHWKSSGGGIFDDPSIIISGIEVTPIDEQPDSAQLADQRFLCTTTPKYVIKPDTMAPFFQSSSCSVKNTSTTKRRLPNKKIIQ